MVETYRPKASEFQAVEALGGDFAALIGGALVEVPRETFLALFEAKTPHWMSPDSLTVALVPSLEQEAVAAPTRDPEQESRVTAQIRKVAAEGLGGAVAAAAIPAEEPAVRSRVPERIKAEHVATAPVARPPIGPRRGLSDQIMALMDDGQERTNPEIRKALGLGEDESQAVSNALGTLRLKNLICKGADFRWMKATTGVKP
jgi:hypothetical protein